MTVDADPYPWPFDGLIEASRVAVVVAGAQRAWYDRCPSAGPVAERIGVVIGNLAPAGATVVLLRHRAPAGWRHPLPPSPDGSGWGLALDPPADALVVDATGIDGFHGSGLDLELRSRGVTHLVVTGFGSEAAVDSTLRSANDRGYECLTLTDAVAPFDPDTGAHALSSITMSGGIFGAVATTDALLAALTLLETT